MKNIFILILLVGLLLVVGAVYTLTKDDAVPAAVVTPVATSTPTLVSSVTFVCQNNKTISASFYTLTAPAAVAVSPTEPPVPTGSVKLTLSDSRSFELPQAISADGARYANPDEAFVFWNKGNGVTIFENGKEGEFVGCVVAAPDTTNLPAVYVPPAADFSLRLPSLGSTSLTYKAEPYTYQVGKGIMATGTKFTIPAAMATGTNLSSDTYLSIEELDTPTCTASAFSTDFGTSTALKDGEVEYSLATTTGAGAGNRYEETVYAIPGTSPCLAVRYFIHYGVFENYASGTVKQFDRSGLVGVFDEIRRTLVVNQ